jgi:LytS/YehU family sensor histidine kinase
MPIAGKAWISFSVEEKDKHLSISISNSANANKPGNGIGLENLRSQLNHLYKEDYQLIVDDTRANEFSVNLILNQTR